MFLKANPVLLVLAFGALVLLAILGEGRVFDNDARVDVRRAPGDDAVVFYWDSAIAAPMARELSDAFSAWRHDASRIVLDLNSPGGSLGEGAVVIEVIEQMKRTHRVDTRVRGGRSCLSMCVPIFLTGQAREAGASSRWLFHEPTARDFFSGDEVNQPAFEKRFAAERFFDRYFVNSPMDAQWGAVLREEWRGRDVWKTGRQLVDEGSNIVTTLL